LENKVLRRQQEK